MPKDTSSTRLARRWCFTLNNWTQEEYVALLGTPLARYAVIGKETGDSGTPHLQGYLVLASPARLSAMKKLSPRAHWEPAIGTSQQAADYCKKDGDFEEVGDIPDQPSASGAAEKQRWEDARTAAKAGKLDDIPADIWLRYYRTLKEVAKDHMQPPPDLTAPCGVWIYGEPGVGKSLKARRDYPNAYKKNQNKWWDGYQHEEYVILDDFDSKELGHHLKIWADAYAFIAETKGGALMIRPKAFVITSNYSPDDLDWDPKIRDAVKRRFKIIHLLDRLGGVQFPLPQVPSSPVNIPFM